MANTVRYVRDSLVIHQELIQEIANTWDPIVFCGRHVVLRGLGPNHDYVIAADELIVEPNAATSLLGSPSVTVMAVGINGSLHVACPGVDGDDGLPGEPGESGIEQPDGGGRPVFLPGGNGGSGGNGGDGMPGGTIRIVYASATETPTGSAPGGQGGAAGAGGPGGPGRPPGRPGRPGKAGAQGAPGIVDIRQVAAEDVLDLLDAESAAGWAAYRAEVAGYFFRKFDPESQLTALSETAAALQLNPSDAEAAIIRTRILNRQTPTGLARDLDIAADFPELAAKLEGEIAIVQGSFDLFADITNLQTIAKSLKEQLGHVRVQLANRREEAQADVAIAEQDVNIAKAEQSNIQAQIDQLQEDIDKAREESFGFGDMISDVATIAGVVAGVASGVGALISIPAGLAALQRVADGKDLVTLLGELKNSAWDPKHPTANEYDIAKAKGLGGGLEDLVKGTNSMISFVKVIADLDGAASQPGQGATGQLLRQQAVLVRQKMVASLREKQGVARVAAARLHVNNLAEEIADVDRRLAVWAEDEETLEVAGDVLLRATRRLVDVVMEDVFLAQRAREIYQLDDTPGLRFDFGFIHPDADRDPNVIKRVSDSALSLAGFGAQVLTWNKIFQYLNTAQIGFDVVHPQLSLTISDPVQLAAFSAGTGLSFSIAVADLPAGMFELKANALRMEMRGASSANSSNVWIVHSGEWSMRRRTDESVTQVILRPRSGVFGFGAGNGTLTANVPAHPQSNPEAGPPFSFWGRGVATVFRLQVAPPSQMDLSRLSAIHITVDCIAFAPQGGPAPPPVTTIAPDVRLMDPSQLLVAAAGDELMV